MMLTKSAAEADTVVPFPVKAVRCRANSVHGNSDLSQTSYAPVEAVRRALILLRTLNTLRTASVGDLHQATGISKPTIVRMLETLISEGYVVRDNFFGGYRVTSQVQALSAGFNGAPLVIEASRRWTVELTKAIKWPVSLGTLCEGEIHISFTTASISPWAYPFGVLHTRLKLASTAMGRCYLAFCSEREEQALLRMLSMHSKAAGAAFDGARLMQALNQARIDGYALPDPFVGSRRFQFIAVPIMDEGNCVACMGIGFYRRAVPSTQIVDRIYRPMRETAAKIEQEIKTLKCA